MKIMQRSRLDTRKALAFLMVAVMVFGPASMAFADLSSLTVTPESQTITTADANATFELTVANDGNGTAKQTTVSIEGNEGIAELSTFNPATFDLDINKDQVVILTVDTDGLPPGDYTFRIRADAPAIGRGRTRQKSSFAISPVITLTVLDGGTSQPDPDPDPQQVEPVLVSISATDVAEGSALRESILAGTFTDSKDAIVAGTLVWIEPDQIVDLTGNFKWKFTPDDMDSYLSKTGLVEVVAYPPQTEPTAVHYVALGDSLVTGTTGVGGTMNSYVHGIFAHLETLHGAGNVTMTILAVDGDDSSDLLKHLNTNLEYIKEVSNADIITISIGGNNVMPAARNSSFWSIDEVMALEGTNRFLQDYPEILATIRGHNTSATIISATLYNPYNSDKQPRGYSGDTELHLTAAKYISQINDLIRSSTSTWTNYRFAEIHDDFLVKFGVNGKMGDVTFFYPTYNVWTWWFVQHTRDPHLNQRGQDLMRDIHIQVIGVSQAFNAPNQQYSRTAAA